MPRIAELCSDIEKIGRFYSSLLLTRRNYCVADNVLSWNSYMPGIFDSCIYSLEYDQLLNKRQYSILWKNLDFMQFFYAVAPDETITEAKLAYYPHPFKRQGYRSEYEESTCHDEFLEGAISDDYTFRELSQTHLRLDYNPAEGAGAPCHLQFGGLNTIRVSMRRLLYPLAFVDFIALNVHHDYRADLIESAAYQAALAWSRSRSVVYKSTDFDLIYGTHD